MGPGNWVGDRCILCRIFGERLRLENRLLELAKGVDGVAGSRTIDGSIRGLPLLLFPSLGGVISGALTSVMLGRRSCSACKRLCSCIAEASVLLFADAEPVEESERSDICLSSGVPMSALKFSTDCARLRK